MHLRPLGHLSWASPRSARFLSHVPVFGAPCSLHRRPAIPRPLEDLRREWDSNPRWAVNPHLISNQVPSATRTSLRGGTWQADRGLSRTAQRPRSLRRAREKQLGGAQVPPPPAARSPAAPNADGRKVDSRARDIQSGPCRVGGSVSVSLDVDATALLRGSVAQGDSDRAEEHLPSDEDWILARHTWVEGGATTSFECDSGRTHIVELDEVTCSGAAEIAEASLLRTFDALHLAALPRGARGVPLRTIDVRETPAARSGATGRRSVGASGRFSGFPS